MKPPPTYADKPDILVGDKIIINSRGTHFDPEIAKIFVELKEDFRAIRDRMKD